MDERMKRMEEAMEKLDEKLDKVVDSVGQINIILAKQHVSLDEHVRRTNLLEQKLEPVEKHVSMVNGALKFIALLGVLAGMIAALHK